MKLDDPLAVSLVHFSEVEDVYIISINDGQLFHIPKTHQVFVRDKGRMPVSLIRNGDVLLSYGV